MGFPIMVDGQCVGAIGISGAPEQDEEIARAGAVAEPHGFRPASRPGTDVFYIHPTTIGAGRWNQNLAAFDHYIASDNRGRPFIIAGLKLSDPHSQGSAFCRNVDELRRQGYAARPFEGFTGAPGRTSALATPILVEDEVYGVLSLIVFSSAMSIGTAVERYIDKLMTTATAIANEIAMKRMPVYPRAVHDDAAANADWL